MEDIFFNSYKFKEKKSTFDVTNQWVGLLTYVINEKILIFYEKITNRFKFNAYAWRNGSCPKGSF